MSEDDIPRIDPADIESVRDGGTVLMSRAGYGTQRRLHAIHPRAVDPEPLCQTRRTPDPDIERPDYLGRWMLKDTDALPEGYYEECDVCTRHIEADEVPQQHAYYLTSELNGKEGWRIRDRFNATFISVTRLAAYAWGMLDNPWAAGDEFEVGHFSDVPWLNIEEDFYVKPPGSLPDGRRGEIEREKRALYSATNSPAAAPASTADSAVAETDGGATTDTAMQTDDEISLPVSDDGLHGLPAQEVVTGRGLMAGVSGAGKSNSAVVVAEEVLDLGIPLVVLDPEGEFVALSDDHPVVVFGDADDADVQGGPQEARGLARRAVEEGIPVVFNLCDYPDERAEQLAGTVADALFAAERQYETPLLLIVDELDEYLPETSKTAASKPLKRVGQRGRKRGLGLLGLSQRPAEVSKGFVTQADYHVWHRLTWKNDIDIAESHLPLEFKRLLGKLEDGEVILDADWNREPTRFRFRMKRVDDLGATPSITSSLGTVPNEVPDDITPDDQPATSSCEDCVFCREGIEPPAHLVDAALDDAGDVLGAYVVQETNDAAVRVAIRENFLVDELGIAEGETVSVGIDDGGVRFYLDGRGLVEHTVGTGPRVTLSSRACSLLAAAAGDHVKLLERDDGYYLERVTDRPDALDYPILGCKQPYTAKTQGEKADYVGLPKPVNDYLGLADDGEIGVHHEEGRVFLTPPSEADLTYQVKGGCPMIGAKGIRPLAAVDGNHIVAHVAGTKRVELVVDRTDTERDEEASDV